MVIAGAAVAAVGLVIPTNLELLVGIYAFGALIAFTVVILPASPAPQAGTPNANSTLNLCPRTSRRTGVVALLHRSM